jgi:hypothetical protein
MDVFASIGALPKMRTMLRSWLGLAAALVVSLPIADYAMAASITTSWKFDGAFVDPVSSGTFSGSFSVSTTDPFAGGAGFRDINVNTSVSGPYSAESYNYLVGNAPNNRLIFANNASDPSAVLYVTCGNADDNWWATQTTNTNCTVADYHGFFFSGDYKNLTGPNTLVRTSALASVTLTAIPRELPEPATIALVIAAMLGSRMFRGRPQISKILPK